MHQKYFLTEKIRVGKFPYLNVSFWFTTIRIFKRFEQFSEFFFKKTRFDFNSAKCTATDGLPWQLAMYKRTFAEILTFLLSPGLTKTTNSAT